ncbi:VWA domain-containing protein [Actinophytocola gossypii]|uniref:VWA domain-containing protein n=1 Tax=Actinophytocola gossypii TaxID=2812003 RepID=A0ABT2J7U4_9PSEU|nr:VWA domain-containing protein [Actinophytocola gossypii]MCT2583684.1 VWA domain-containing protein [Actinophytocola gossypii]
MGRKALASVLAVAAVLAGCDSAPEPAAESAVLRVLAGSELADLEPVLDEAARVTGVRVEFTFTGTLEGTETLASGEADGAFDAVWFSSNRYPRSLPEADRRLGDEVKIMRSPVVLGLPEAKVRELGWDRTRPTWADIAEAAGQGRFTYGMTDPSASNSGFSALVGVASALAGTGDAVTPDQIDAVAPAMTRFFSAQKLSAGSSGWLSEEYQRRLAGTAPGPKVDGLINYESVLRTLPTPLTVVYPADGVVTADYPLTVLTSASADARAAHQRLADHLRSPETQRRIMADTYRRPAVPGVALSDEFAVRDLVELPFPATQDAMDALLRAYFNELRRPSRTLYVLDTSGSMQGERIAGLKSALVALTGADGSLVGRYRGFRSREEVTLLPFGTVPGRPRTFTLPPGDPAAELARISAYAEALTARGGTAIYDSLVRAYELLGDPDPARFTSIVLMTDGENRNGSPLTAFERELRASPSRAVPVFTVLYGESHAADMTRVAELTGGEVFDARSSSLAEVFRDIRGYQ